MKIDLIKKLKNKSAKIGIFGLGYVGLPLALRFSERGYKTVGFDIDKSKISKLLKGKSYINYISSKKISACLNGGFQATSDFSISSNLDALIVCVPTPLNKKKEPDLSFIEKTVEMFLPYLHKGQIVSLESTTYPGTTNEIVLPRLISTGLKVGKDIFLIYSPEREDPGNLKFQTQHIPKIVGGISKDCLNVGIDLYQNVIDKIIPVSSVQVAEMSKLLENIHRAVNIGLINEMKIIADSMNIDIYEVISAASTKPFGFTPYFPGPGLGGHCIPIDPYYMAWRSKKFGINARFIELAGEVNTNMPKWVVQKTKLALKKHGKSLKGSRLLILGIAYKKNVQDTRESPAVELIKIFLSKRALVDYSDPYIPIFPKMRKYNYKLKSIKITPKTIRKYDSILLLTDHDSFDYQLIQKNAQLIVDTRGVYKNIFHNLIRA